MVDAIRESGSQLVTLAMKRVDLRQHNDAILAPLLEAGVTLLPNTSGAKTAEEAIFAAQLAREALGTRWLKLEIHPDARWLLPDPIETLKAAEKLVQQGFTVLPYCGADPVLCKRLEEVGCAAVMPLGAPIGSNQGWRPARCWKSLLSRRPCRWWWMRASAYPVTPRRRWRWGRCGAGQYRDCGGRRPGDDGACVPPCRGVRSAGSAVRPGSRSVQAQATSPLTDFLEAL